MDADDGEGCLEIGGCFWWYGGKEKIGICGFYCCSVVFDCRCDGKRMAGTIVSFA